MKNFVRFSPLHMMSSLRTTVLALALLGHASVWAAPLDQVIAVVDSTPILKSELDQAVSVVSDQLQKKGQPVPSSSALRKSVLDQLILRQAQVEQVKRYGIEPTSATLDNAVLAVAKQEGFDRLEDFQASLDSKKSGSYAQMREQVAQDLSVMQLRQQLISSRIQISERDVDNFLNSPQGQAALGNQVKTLHMRVAPTVENVDPKQVMAVANELKVAMATTNEAETLAKRYSNAQIAVQGVSSDFRSLAEIPADLAARISPLQVGQTSEPIINKDGIHLVKLLDRKSDDKKALVQQYQVRHILLQPSEVMSLADAKQRLVQIAQRIQQGAKFEEMASTYSTDPGSARNGGSLGWVSPGMMVPAFEEVMKTTPVGQVSAPFQTQYGWHILKVEETRQMDMTNEMQRRMAKQILGERQFDTEVDSWLREVRANAYVDIKDPTLKDDTPAS